MRYVSVGGVVARSPMADGPIARGCRRARVTSSVSCSNASLAFRCPGTMYSSHPSLRGICQLPPNLLRAAYIRNLDKPHNRIISAGADISTGIT